MDTTSHNKIVSFIWSIADDCLRDVFVRGKYRDVILPMFVLRRLDCLLEPTKQAVLEEVRFQREEAGFNELDNSGLTEASGYLFYNTSNFTLKSLLGNPSQLEANFKTYLDSFSQNVKEIISNFDLYNQARKMAQADVLHDVIEKFVAENINLSSEPKKAADGRILPALTNLGMGYVFEELIRKFNEENNEEAGEHFTPREVIHLMTNILFEPVKTELPPVITVYDPACGSGGMLTEAQNYIINPEGGIKSDASIYLFGKEVNPETYAICKSDMMIKGNDPEHIKLGSTLATDEFSGRTFNFMLSNPPYGKSWKTDMKYIKDGKDVIDPRFQVSLANFDGTNEIADATPRSSDGQLLFLMEMVSKIKSLSESPIGSRIASVQNGSALFTGDAGGGESNIRRYIIQSDYLEAIIQLPNNLFYNTGITTYIWILSNAKKSHRKGKVQLINASEMYQKLRKNLGEKNCELADKHIKQISQIYSDFKNEGASKIFNNSDFGYHKVIVERPLRLKAKFKQEAIDNLRFVPSMAEIMQWIYDKYGEDVYSDLKEHKKAIEAHIEKEGLDIKQAVLSKLLTPKTWIEQKETMEAARQIMQNFGVKEYNDFNAFQEDFSKTVKELGIKLSSSQQKQILTAISWRDEEAEKVVKKLHNLNAKKIEQLCDKLKTTKENLADYGYFPTKKVNEFVEYETDSELRDSENIPLAQDIHEYFLNEVKPHVTDAWLDIAKTQIGYEISFNKYFYEHKPLRDLNEVAQEILQLEDETEGLLKKLVSLTLTTNKSKAA